MPPKTRAQAKKEKAQEEVQNGEQKGQLNQPPSQQVKKQVKLQAKIRSKKPANQALDQTAVRQTISRDIGKRNQRGKPSRGQQASEQSNRREDEQDNQTSNPQVPQADRAPPRHSKERRIRTQHLREGLERTRSSRSLQRTQSGIRKKRFVRWQGVVLPRFDIPYWKIRAGIPTLVLRMLASGSGVDTAHNNHDSFEEIEIDSESSNDVPSHSDRPDASNEDPTPSRSASASSVPPTPPIQASALPPRPSPPPPPPPPPPPLRAAVPRDRHDHPISVESRATTPSKDKFPSHVRDDPDNDVEPPTFTNLGLANKTDIEKWGIQMARFIRSPFDDTDDAEGWHGLKPLGKGSFGIAGLWEKRDVDGKVIDVSCLILLRNTLDTYNKVASCDQGGGCTKTPGLAT